MVYESNTAVRQAIARAIEAAHCSGKPIGICGQASSDYPDFAAWLVREGINSISLNPDMAIKTAFVIAEEEGDPTAGPARRTLGVLRRRAG